MGVVAAAILYVAIVFGAGFVLGTVRVLMLERRLGETLATLCEAPFLLIVMVLAARWLPARLRVTPAIAPLAAMGVGALMLQQLTDFAFGNLLRGMTLREQLTPSDYAGRRNLSGAGRRVCSHAGLDQLAETAASLTLTPLPLGYGVSSP